MQAGIQNNKMTLHVEFEKGGRVEGEGWGEKRRGSGWIAEGGDRIWKNEVRGWEG
jgi:hypothetical protein